MTMSERPALLWSAILGLTAIIGSYGFACVFPFAAMATLAAVTLDTRRAALLVGVVWLANQIVGFTLMNYPHDAQAYVWGGAILVSALAALAAARAVAVPALLSLRSIGALAVAIIAYQALMFIAAVALDGLESSTPTIVAQVALSDVAWFTGLAALRLLITRTAPRLFALAAA